MIKKTAIVLICAVLIVSVLASGCTFNVGNTSSSTTSTTYTSAKGYSIKYSSDWSKPEEQQSGSFVVFLTPTNNVTENLNVQVVNLSASDTLATVTDDVISTAQGYDNFKQIETTNTTLAGLPANKIVYMATINDDQLKLLQMWTVKDGKAYVITYKGSATNYGTHLGAAQQMIDSFQIN
ncbi:MAG: PsbP-related protein [Halobacteriota archaeon]